MQFTLNSMFNQSIQYVINALFISNRLFQNKNYNPLVEIISEKFQVVELKSFGIHGVCQKT